MCIFEDGRICILLTVAEQLAQHNFEERKGPYPKELVDRLHEQGIITRELHLAESIARRSDRVRERLYWLSATYPDCSAEERLFMQGLQHQEPPRDDYLLDELQPKLTARLHAARKEHFLRTLNRAPSIARLELLVTYPEFGSWFAERLHDCKRNFRHMERVFDVACHRSKLLAAFIAAVGTNDRCVVAKYLLQRFLGKGTMDRYGELVGILTKNLEKGVCITLQDLMLWNTKIEALPTSTRKHRKAVREERRKLRAALRILNLANTDAMNTLHNVNEAVRLINISQPIALSLAA